MKKLLVYLFLLIVVSFSASYVKAGGEFVDQSNTSGTGSLKICTGSIMYQTFKPTVNRIHKIEIDIAHASGEVNSNIKKLTGGGWEDANYPEAVNVQDGWNTFDFIDFPVTPGDTYAINVYADCSSAAQWKYSTTNSYSNGFMIWQSNEQPNWDFNFKIIGQIDESLITKTVTTTATAENNNTDDSAADDSGNLVTEDSDGSKTFISPSEPLGEVSSAIAKPTELKAEFNTKDRAVNLSWTASTTSDIAGYKVFKSTDNDKNLVKIAETTSKISKYQDKNVKPNTKYFYVVRSYKGSMQSASSNKVNITTPQLQPIAMRTTALSPVNQTQEKSFIQRYWPYLLAVVVLVIAGGLLIYFKYYLPKLRARKQQKEKLLP